VLRDKKVVFVRFFVPLQLTNFQFSLFVKLNNQSNNNGTVVHFYCIQEFLNKYTIFLFKTIPFMLKASCINLYRYFFICIISKYFWLFNKNGWKYKIRSNWWWKLGCSHSKMLCVNLTEISWVHAKWSCYRTLKPKHNPTIWVRLNLILKPNKRHQWSSGLCWLYYFRYSICFFGCRIEKLTVSLEDKLFFLYHWLFLKQAWLWESIFM
jgi:hypothetical protein